MDIDMQEIQTPNCAVIPNCELKPRLKQLLRLLKCETS